MSCWNKRKGRHVGGECNNVADDANEDDDDAIRNPAATHTHVGPLNLHSQARLDPFEPPLCPLTTTPGSCTCKYLLSEGNLSDDSLPLFLHSVRTLNVYRILLKAWKSMSFIKNVIMCLEFLFLRAFVRTLQIAKLQYRHFHY